MAANPQLLIRIAASIDELKRNLAEGKGAIEVTTAGMQKLAASLDGSKLEQRAHNITAAIAEVGGASKLTDAEARRLLPTLDAWIEKGQRMGKEIPPAILQTRDALKAMEPPATAANSSFASMKSLAVSAGAAIAAAFTLNAIKGAVTSFTEFTGSLTDMAAKTGIGTTELQKLKFAAEQNGGSLEGVTGAIGKMGKALVEGNTSTVGAMKSLGLSFTDVRNMDPATAFATIGDAIAKVPNPLERSKIAMDLFGKSGADLLPMMTGNLSDTMKAAERLGIVLDEQTVAAGDNLGDTMSSLQSVGMAIIGKVLAPMLPAFQAVATAMLGAGNVVDWLRNAFDALARIALLAIKAIVDGAIKVGEFAAKVPGLTKVLGDDAAAMHSMKDASTFLGGAIEGLEKGTTATTVAVKTLHAPIGTLTEGQTKAGKATDEHAKALQAIHDKLTGDGLIKAATEYVAAIAKGIDVQTLTAAAQADINKTMAAAIEVYTAQGTVAPEAMRLLYIETLKLPPLVSAAGSAFKDLGDHIAIAIPKLQAWGVAVEKGAGDWGKVGEKIDFVVPKVKKTGDGLDELAKSFAQLAQIGGASFGSLMRDIGSLVSAMDAAEKQNKKWGGSAGIASAMFSDQATTSEKWASGVASAATIANGAMAAWAAGATSATNATAAFNGAMSGAQAGAAFGPWGAAIGAAGGALLGFIAHMNAGRKAVEEFAATFGGFDDMHAKLLTLGAAGEALWVKLTQGVGRGNPAEAKRVIDEINAALAASPAVMAAASYKTVEDLQKVADQAKAVYDYMLSSGKYSASEIAKAFEASKTAQIAAMGDTQRAQQDSIDAITAKYTDSLAALETEYKSLSQSVAAEAEEAEMGVVETQQRARLAQIEAEKKAQEIMRDVEIAAKQESFAATIESARTADEAVRALFGRPMKIPIEWAYPDAPQGGGAPVPMAEGGDFLVTRPTLFLAGEAGPERATFSGAHQGSAPSTSGGSRAGGSGVSTAAMERELAEIRRLLRDQPRAMAIAVSDARALRRAG